MRRVILVCGPPCAGKTTYVAQHAQPGDIVLDQDVIGAHAMRQGLAKVSAMTAGTAWVIRCAPGPTQRAALARQLGAEIVLLDPGEHEAVSRAAHRPHPRRHIQGVRDWYQRETTDAPRKPRARSTPRAHLTTTQRGYGWEHQQARARALRDLVDGEPCPFCSHPMARDMRLDYDHYPPLALGGGGVRRLSHARCNRSAGSRMRHRRDRVTINSRVW